MMWAVIVCLLVGIQLPSRDLGTLKATIQAPNSDGDPVLCPSCAGFARLSGATLDLRRQVQVFVDGQEATVDVAWDTSLWFEVPAGVRAGSRGSHRRVRVEIVQGELRFVGFCYIAASNPRFSENQNGQIAGIWRYGLNGAINFTAQQPIQLGRQPTFILFHVWNVGEAFVGNTITVYIGTHRFPVLVSWAGISGMYSLVLVLQPDQLPAGTYPISIYTGTRLSPPALPLAFARAAGVD